MAEDMVRKKMEGEQRKQEAPSPPKDKQQKEAPGPKDIESQMSPEEKQKAAAYTSGLLKLLHSPDTSGRVLAMLKTAKPEVSVPKSALAINGRMEQMIQEKKATKPSLETLLLGSVALVNDLIEIGNAGDAWGEDVGPERAKPILQNTMQQYIQQGLKDGSIDPVELQAKVEPLMDEEHRAAGLQGAQATGIPTEANEQTAMESYATQRERKVLSRQAEKEAGENRKEAMMARGRR